MPQPPVTTQPTALMTPADPMDEASLLGQPSVIAPMMPHLHYETSLQYYVQMTEAPLPSAPPISPSPPQTQEHSRFWQHYGLDLIMGLNQVLLRHRIGDKYTIRNMSKALLYTATIDTETTCFCCSVPRGEGVTFNVTSRNQQQVLKVHRTTQMTGCTDEEKDVEVRIPPDVMIGTVEERGHTASLINPSGEITCYVEMESDDCCYCSWPSHKVVPVAFPDDVGSVEATDGGLIITFPTVLDVANRVLLLCCALNIQYTSEESRKASAL
ncbi:uncharacterized protein LOC127009569 [Eriocheir sinensis]|uniref:uncharacterized protein LOC127009569 n=1 Tax=Eriocheir sinensis TaxID=95602 RepID=UPI0021C65669|nr:uncharacterized protein LOC127009569 [Eriocheir sinensis]XP_050738731.1 uncharacterized protein LOC127009569 [Eriocheir sinensis]XP_050738732.1 uncharacterized protein LOC127009569 [Eriocheir sinensis]XP_050738733.1 uncharacterized protein LOC127009569 [Eriocheir sinensis]